MSDWHYWKHGVYRGFPHLTPNATVAILDGFTRALTFEDAAYGAFGDVPVAPSAGPGGQSNQPGANSTPGVNTPSTVTSGTASLVVNAVVSVAVLVTALW